jgi:hypothetical protein
LVAALQTGNARASARLEGVFIMLRGGCLAALYKLSSSQFKFKAELPAS